MNRRNTTGLLVLAAIIAAIAYLWQPWIQDAEPLRLGLDLQGGLRVVLEAEGPTPLPEDLTSARSVIENRVNQFGVSEPLIQTSGDNRIVVELPGLSSEDQDRALDLIGQQAVLEFRLVKPEAGGRSTISNPPLSLEDLEPAAFNGEILQNASADFNRVGGATLGGALVLFDIKREFANDFGDFTGSNIGRNMAIVLDDVIITAPEIQGRISSNGQISGAGDIEEATDTALVLRSGSLPIELGVQEIRAIGPTLGQDSINAGTRAALIGSLAVVIAILLYYGPLFGGVLTVGLALAMLFIFGILAGLGAVLTLPGLAGLVLTIGAAVDGNVISFERIKEELRQGKSLRLAMKNGFGNSLSAIIDANVTTLLAAAALYQYTTGPVRGFAVTLAIGIISAVFVNTVVVPFLLDVLTIRNKKPLMSKGFETTNINFVGIAPRVMLVSGLLAVLSLGIVAVRGFNFSVDFSGGTTALYQVDEDLSTADIRSTIDGLGIEGLSEPQIQEVQDPTITEAEGAPDNSKLVSVRVNTAEGQDTANQFATSLASALNTEALAVDFVGPSVGSDLRLGAIYAVLVALALILVYVAWRFWPTWIIAIAAIVAVMHDVLITLGVQNLLGAEFSVPVLAALLFVVGYSLNDSIIIADRIRENLRKVRGADYAEIVELSVNQTLSRTIVTSGTTLLPVLALLFFGGSVLRDFSVTLLIGIGIGTYSSIFILAPMVVWFKSRQRTSTPKRRKAA